MVQRGAVSLADGSVNDGEQSLMATDVAAPNSSPQYAVSRLWMPMSPIAPVPKSQKPRHLNGTYASLYGRVCAGPSQTSQSRPAGTGGVSVGRVNPRGQQPAGRSGPTCISLNSAIN